MLRLGHLRRLCKLYLVYIEKLKKRRDMKHNLKSTFSSINLTENIQLQMGNLKKNKYICMYIYYKSRLQCSGSDTTQKPARYRALCNSRRHNEKSKAITIISLWQKSGDKNKKGRKTRRNVVFNSFPTKDLYISPAPSAFDFKDPKKVRGNWGIIADSTFLFI